MLKRLIPAVIFLSIVFVFNFCFGFEIKKPNVAGMFYPSNPEELKNLVDSFIDNAEIEASSGDIKAIVVPHAGYVYSGSVAGYAYKAIKGKNFKTVVIIAPSHHESFDGISIYEEGVFKTPLGDLAVDSDISKRFVNFDKKIFYFPKAFLKEHALEVELPFLQRSLEDFKIVPMIFGNPSRENSKLLGDALTKVLKDRSDTLVVISTDMSHYYSYEKAKKLDYFAIEKVKKLDYEGLSNSISKDECELCGFGGLIAGMIYCKNIGASKVEILKYANSGDTAGNKNEVVGYFSAVFLKEKEKKENSMASNSKLTNSQRKRLLEIAKKSIEYYVKNRKKMQFEENDPMLTKIQGAFVTLKENGELRGCIGNIEGSGPLYLTVAHMAIEAATGDPRFMPVTEKELPNIKIEISVLSPLEKVKSADEITLGKHGVIVKKGFNSGVFLPQVAGETGWSKEEFLCYLCEHKAGLPKDAWKDKNTELYVFSAEVFGEDDVK